MKKNKYKRIILSGIFLSAIFVFSILFIDSALAQYEYAPIEKIPGSGTPDSFESYVLAIYNFAIWAVGIAALFMVSIGGFMYFTSAGNTSKLEKAKSVITDALLGVVAVMTAYLILYVINPDLVNVNLSTLSIDNNNNNETTQERSECEGMSQGAICLSIPGEDYGRCYQGECISEYDYANVAIPTEAEEGDNSCRSDEECNGGHCEFMTADRMVGHCVSD